MKGKKRQEKRGSRKERRKNEKEEEGRWKKKWKRKNWSSCHGTVETNLTRNHEVAGLIPAGLIPALAQWVKDLASL